VDVALNRAAARLGIKITHSAPGRPEAGNLDRPPKGLRSAPARRLEPAPTVHGQQAVGKGTKGLSVNPSDAARPTVALVFNR
jgi:hypothetical protein